jgi:hypothetical protein
MNALQIGRFTVFTKLNIYRFYYVYLLTSDFILNELHEKLTVKFKYSPEDAGEVIKI